MITLNQAEKHIDDVLLAGDTKYWVKNALIAALSSDDYADALKNAEMVAQLLRQRCVAISAWRYVQSSRRGSDMLLGGD